MERRWKEMIGVFLMGVLMPGLVLQFGDLLTPVRGQVFEPATEPTYLQQTQTQPQPQPQQESVLIPVLMADNTVKMMELDAYIICVVIAEMPADFEEEALKAQAVVARTYTLKRVRDGIKHTAGAICTDSTCCQAYMTEAAYEADGGTRENLDKIRTAVHSTAGQVLTYEGALIDATYFSCSGGRTEDAVAVWGAEVPYLQSVISPGEEQAQPYSHTVTFTGGELAALLGRKLTGKPKSWLGTVTYTRGGGVATMVLAGKSYTGTELRKLLSLNSTAFSIKAEGDTVTVTTSGKGHRVGMSQYGADAMAVAGSTYEEILVYYYQGTRIDKIESLG